ncbi:MAG TPA: hypothetical protein VJN18_11875, partial [Polyangiaceae bacterium]|nr:hypothetical protein [Polyangiaceae bacterium]
LQAETYLGKMAPPVVGRVLNADERALVTEKGGAAIGSVVSGWLKEPGFVKSARRFVELGLQVSGTLNGVDFDLPGNLVEYVVTSNRPWSEILTSESCYDAALQPIACDTGAPYTAGVLTTRAYLISRSSRFNLTRSSALMKNFACQVYPQEETLQPKIIKERLIPMFQANTPEEQTDDRAKSGFGNGLGCYSCHGQFSLHAQLYVKFNSAGLYKAEATGLQDPDGELGRSLGGLMASHLQNATEAASEHSNMFGQDVENLKAAAKVVANQATFAPCAARRFLDFALGVQSGSIEYDAAIFDQVVTAAKAVQPELTLPEIVMHLLTHPTVVTSVVDSLTGVAP